MVLLRAGDDRNKINRPVLIAMFCLSAGILAADLYTTLGYFIWIFYIVPLLMSVYLSYRYSPFLTALLISGALLLGGVMARTSQLDPIDITQRAVFTFIIVIVAILVWEIQTNNARFEEEFAARSKAEEDLIEINQTLEKRVADRTRELSELNKALQKDNKERIKVEAALSKANQKLNLLSSITRHDILNRVFVLLMEIDLIKEDVQSQKLPERIQKLESYALSIESQVKFTKDYQDIGIQTPQWYDVRTLVKNTVSQFDLSRIQVDNTIEGIEIYADPLIEKVFYNLIDNALRHGGNVTKLTFSTHPSENGQVIVCEDNGEGIAPEIKRHIFTKGFGKHTGFGLFLIREILSITGMTIEETGEPKKGARFEITVPEKDFVSFNVRQYQAPSLPFKKPEK